MLDVASSSFVHVHTRPELRLQPVSSLHCKTPKFGAIHFAAKKGRWRIRAAVATESSNRTGEQSLLADEVKGRTREKMTAGKKRVFFLDVNPLCYEGSTPSLRSFGRWLSLFFSEVSLNDPVIAVIDGEGGSEHRRQLLPTYKAHRKKFSRYISTSRKAYVGRSSPQIIKDVLRKCNVPVVQVQGQEADDVVATLTSQVLQKGYNVVVASPDKDFKQLISDDVQIVMPVPELGRWSFYTLKHYIAQYDCDPCSDLSLRCILGDEVDGVPGIQHFAPAFGRKTAVKLMKKHGSLENLLNAAAIRTVGKPYAQDALMKHADYLRRNYEVLALRRDVDVLVQEDLLVERNTCNDSTTLDNLFKMLEDMGQHPHEKKSHSSDGLPSNLRW